MTNFERIKNMTADEMAELLKNKGFGNCMYCELCMKLEPDDRYSDCQNIIKDWLESEVEECSK